MTTQEIYGLGPYSPEEYAALDIDEYRRRFPNVTSNFTDMELYEIVRGTDDDMDDHEWIDLFTRKSGA